MQQIEGYILGIGLPSLSMDLPTDVEELVAVLRRASWKEDIVDGPQEVPILLLRNDDGFLFEVRRERMVWKGRLDRGDGWRSLAHIASVVGLTPGDDFNISAVPGRSAALAFQAMPQDPYVRWETLVPRCIEWLRAAPPTPEQPSGDLLAALARRDFHQACIEIIDRRTHGLHLRPMPPVPALARQSPVELLRWLREHDVHERIRWDRDHLLNEAAGSDVPSSIGGESQMLWVAYLDEPNASPDPWVVIHDQQHHDFIRGELLASMPLSRYIFDCLISPSDFHSAWTRPANAIRTESVLWSDATSPLSTRATPPFPLTVGATWVQLDELFLVDDPVQASEEFGGAAHMHTLFEWGTRTVEP